MVSCQISGKTQSSVAVEKQSAIAVVDQEVHTSPSTVVRKNSGSGTFSIVEFDASNGLTHRQGEVSVAVNRNNPDQAVAATMNIQRGTNEGGLLVATTHNGGTHWLLQTVNLSPSVFMADPFLAWDGEGRVFLAQIPVQSGNIPLGIEVSRSTDGGISWELPVRISSNLGSDDKVALTVDDNKDSPFFGNIYVSWKWPGGPIWFSRSTDHGVSYSTPKSIDNKGTSGLDMTVTQDGAIIIAHNFAGAGVFVQRSLDGGLTFQPAQLVASKNAGYEVFPYAHCTNPGAFINASIDAYRPVNEDSGLVLLTWVDCPDTAPSCSDPCNNDCPTRVRYSVSQDEGQSWSVAQSLEAAEGSQFFQWSDIDQANGDWYITYRDSSVDPGHLSSVTRLVRSTDQGLSWSEPVQLSSVSSTTFDWPGHYNGLASHDGKVYAGWGDYRAATQGDFFLATAHARDRGFQMNAGLNDAWVSVGAPFQGIFITVLPLLQKVFVAWFTFDSVPPVGGERAVFGANDQRWVTGLGDIIGNRAEISMELTTGGAFNQSSPLPTQDTEYGTMTLEFTDCSNGSVSFEVPDAGVSGEFTIHRVIDSNVSLCEALSDLVIIDSQNN
jgi:hypothetical protein